MTLQVGDLIPIGGSGNAKRTDVLQGKTYSSDEGTELVGTMPNRGDISKELTWQEWQELINNSSGGSPVINLDGGYYSPSKITVSQEDVSLSPGSKKLKVGTIQEGYFGSVTASQLITGNNLASRLGVSEGTAHNSDTPWHKFAWKGKILFIAQKTIRYSISWDHLKSKDLVYGGKTIEINGVKYKVRLIRGALADPAILSDVNRGIKGSEWNRLVCPLSIRRKDNSWGTPTNVEIDLQDWGTYLSDKELGFEDSSSNGTENLCQEISATDSTRRVHRGKGQDISVAGTTESYSASWRNGWRPVLEVVQ